MRPTSLKGAVDRIVVGQNWVDAISGFLDEFYLSGPAERQRMIGESDHVYLIPRRNRPIVLS